MAEGVGGLGGSGRMSMRVCPRCGTQNAADVLYCRICGTQVTVTDVEVDEREAPRLGTVLGSYRLVDLLGEGGMGQVYLAEHTRLGRKVALKLLRSEYASNPRAVKRFFTEARAVNQISHENIVEITDF